MYNSDDNILIGAPPGSGKTTIAELAILRLLTQNSVGRCVYIVTKESLAELLFTDWHNKFSQQLGIKVTILFINNYSFGVHYAIRYLLYCLRSSY